MKMRYTKIQKKIKYHIAVDRDKYKGFKIIIYVVVWLILAGIISLFKIRAEIFVGLILVFIISWEIYWKIKYVKYDKYLREKGHAGLSDFVEIKVKSAELAVLTFKSEKFAEYVKHLNKQNLVFNKNFKIRK